MALPIESDGERFERVATIFDTAGFLHSLGIRLEKVGPDWCETSLDITDAHRQQHGYVHAGVVTTLADHTAGGAARAAVAPGKDVLTLRAQDQLPPARPLRAARGQGPRSPRRAPRHRLRVGRVRHRVGRAAAHRQAALHTDGARRAAVCRGLVTDWEMMR